MHTVLPPALCPHTCPSTTPSSPLASRQNLFCLLLQFCWREDMSNNKKDKTFLLVWHKDSYTERIPSIASMHMCITYRIASSLPDLFTTSWAPFHSDFCLFKVTILAPLQWTDQTLSNFGFPTFPYSSCMHYPLNAWPMSINITAFVLRLKSTYEGNMIFGLLSLANFA
jgi:hypothetical protein